MTNGVGSGAENRLEAEEALRAGAQESLLREVNERIEQGQWPGEEEHGAGFRCECARLDCNAIVELSPNAYGRIREHPRRFVVAPGHEEPAVERVVERAEDYLVVEKEGIAGTVAAVRDPRSGAAAPGGEQTP